MAESSQSDCFWQGYEYFATSCHCWSSLLIISLCRLHYKGTTTLVCSEADFLPRLEGGGFTNKVEVGTRAGGEILHPDMISTRRSIEQRGCLLFVRLNINGPNIKNLSRLRDLDRVLIQVDGSRTLLHS